MAEFLPLALNAFVYGVLWGHCIYSLRPRMSEVCLDQQVARKEATQRTERPD